MKKVIFIMSVLGLLWGCKKEKIEPVDAPQFESGNQKIVYSLSQVVGSPVLGKSTYKWNESGRLVEMSTYVDSNGTGYRLYEKRNLEYKENRVSKYVLSEFAKDSLLQSQHINEYTYENNNLVLYVSNSKSYNRSNSFFDFTNSYSAKYSNDSVLYYTTHFLGKGIGSESSEYTDTTLAEYLAKNNSKREVYYYKNLNFVSEEKYKFGTNIKLDKNSKKLSQSSSDYDKVELKENYSIEFTELKDPLSDLVFFGTNTSFWVRLVDDWFSDLGMNNLYKQIRTDDKTVYNYEHLINANGLLTKTNVIVTDSLGNSKTNTTTFFY